MKMLIDLGLGKKEAVSLIWTASFFVNYPNQISFAKNQSFHLIYDTASLFLRRGNFPTFAFRFLFLTVINISVPG